MHKIDGFVDLHSHIIPTVDDGSPDMDSSMELVRKAYDEGVRAMFATPHFGSRNKAYDWDRADVLFGELKERVALELPDMELYQGTEIYFGPGAVSGLADGYAKTLAGSRYALIEFPYSVSLDMVLDGCRKVMMGGHTPILAHAERYRNALRKLSDVEEVIRRDILIQMNSLSVLSETERRTALGMESDPEPDESFMGRHFRKRAEKEQLRFCRDMIKEGFVSFMGTDCHSLKGREPIMKLPYEIVKEISGEKLADRVFTENACSIVL